MSPAVRAGVGTPRVLVASGPDALARTSADLVVAALAGAVGAVGGVGGVGASGANGVAHLALTGGSSASGLYRELRSPERVDGVDWSRVHLWFGDDRVVPLDDPDSNAGLARRELLGAGGPPLTRASLHPMLAGLDATTPDAGALAAGRYADELGLVPHDAEGVPVFDLLLLGMGPDGHVLSVFPGSAALSPDAPIVSAIAAPTHLAPSVPRVTLHPAVIAAARSVLLIVGGAAKATVVADVLEGDPTIEAYPARLARLDTATWLLDQAASALLGAG